MAELQEIGKDNVNDKDKSKCSSDNDSRADGIFDRKHSLTLYQAAKFRIAALSISYATIVFLILLSIATFYISISQNNSASFAFGLAALLDCVSSAIVIWRYGSGGNYSLYNSRRERLACIALGVIFNISSLVIISKTSYALGKSKKPLENSSVEIISAINGSVCIMLAVGKYFIGKYLESEAVTTDAFNSFIESLMAFSIVINEALYKKNPSIWYVDAIVSYVSALLFTIWGMRLLIINLSKKAKAKDNYNEYN
ncbi:unnamed protein product [Dimorphilus gyrociliatus]|uniref:Uncharacterized protein n=1 Tax=Dimorphilus gyrociliatus TaxID=2664684 RepID=A0A7I8VZ30_9ANNE|nr:unnamed protein product [Dimorphilus gyrociliatus]